MTFPLLKVWVRFVPEKTRVAVPPEIVLFPNWRSKLPLAFDTDLECIQSTIDTCWQPVQDRLQVCIIPNTLEVTEVWVSESLAVEARTNPDLEVVGSPIELPFDAAGNLDQEKLFPHSVRAKRSKG